MGNLKERTVRLIVNVLYLWLCIAFVMLVLSFIGWVQGCHMHVMEKHYHYAGEQPAVEITNDEGLELEIDE